MKQREIKKTIRPKSILLTPELLEKICNIINEQYAIDKEIDDKKIDDRETNDEFKEKYKELSFIRKSFSFSFSKGHNETTDDSKEFLESINLKKYREIHLNFYGDNKEISVWFNAEYEFRDITIESEDKMWVGGITEQFNVILKQYETSNRFFYTKPAWAIYSGIPILIMIGIIFAINSDLKFFEQENPTLLSSFGEVVVIFFMLFIAFPIGGSIQGLFQKLYPRLEIENSRPVKIRKWVLFALVSIILSVIGSGVFTFIQSFQTIGG